MEQIVKLSLNKENLRLFFKELVKPTNLEKAFNYKLRDFELNNENILIFLNNYKYCKKCDLFKEKSEFMKHTYCCECNKIAIACNCGVRISEKHYKRHIKTKSHLEKVS